MNEYSLNQSDKQKKEPLTFCPMVDTTLGMVSSPERALNEYSLSLHSSSLLHVFSSPYKSPL